MKSSLQRTYFSFLIPAGAGFIFAFAGRQSGLLKSWEGHLPGALIVTVFILSIVLAVAAPVFLRSVFAHRHRQAKQVSEEDFIRFEQSLIRTVLLAPYLGLAAYLFCFPRFYLAGAFLAGLYAVYYFYPSTRRIAFEKRIFRVSHQS